MMAIYSDKTSVTEYQLAGAAAFLDGVSIDDAPQLLTGAALYQWRNGWLAGRQRYLEKKSNTNVAIWDDYYASLKDAYLFPNEYVVRSFLGNYPGLAMDRHYRGKRVCDISCGDGRNLTALHKFGFDLFGTEISDDIVRITKDKLAESNDRIMADIRTGSNTSLPFESGYFDYLLSWNACYYMKDEGSNIADHVAEYARIAKPGAWLVASIPAPGCFSLQGAESLGNDLIRIKTDSKWDMLNGTIYHQFKSWTDIESRFGSHFRNFQRCTIKDDCFGLALEYFVFVCQKI